METKLHKNIRNIEGKTPLKLIQDHLSVIEPKPYFVDRYKTTTIS